MDETPRPSGASNFDASAVEHRLAELWRDVLGVRDVGVHDDFFRSGGDSLAAVELICQIKKSFCKNLALESLVRAPTIASLAQLIGHTSNGEVHTNLVGLQTQGTRPPFYCVHGVGGEVIGFTNLARHMGTDQPFYGIRSTARHQAELRAPTLESLAAEHIGAIRSLQPSGPYYLGGYSFGGSIAYEMARQLEAQGDVVELLAILDHTPPPLRYQIALNKPGFYLEFLSNLPYWILYDVFLGDLGELGSRIRTRVRSILRRISHRLTRAPSMEVTRDEVESLFDLSRFPASFRESLEHHYGLLRHYTPSPFGGAVTLFRARSRPLFRLHGYDLGWTKLAQGGVKVVVIPGNHTTMLREPHVKLLAERLAESLRSAPASAVTNDRPHAA